MRTAAGTVALLNPNSSTAVTQMMVAIAAHCFPGHVEGLTATRAPRMITDGQALDAAAAEVVEMGERAAAQDAVAGVIVAAFGDPGLAELRERLSVPVTGICEAAMAEAAAGGRRFGVATTTPDLLGAIDARALALGHGALYTGTRVTPGDPVALLATPRELEDALAEAVLTCVRQDGAEAVVIGGGPLGQAAESLSARLSIPVVAPVPAAVRALLARLGAYDDAAPALVGSA